MDQAPELDLSRDKPPGFVDPVLRALGVAKTGRRAQRDELPGGVPQDASGGVICLPAPKGTLNKACIHTQRSFLTLPKEPVRKRAGEFTLSLEIVEKGRLKLWNEFIDRYHYLGYTPLPGAQIRYFVKDQDEILALLGFSAAAWKTEPRDSFIGWDARRRKQNLHLVANNSRFLVLPWVQSKNLASRILALAGKRLPSDWHDRYCYRPVLLESFVEKERFEGTCYKAANWIYVGDTQGRGKLDIRHEHKVPVKAVWVPKSEIDFIETCVSRPFRLKKHRINQESMSFLLHETTFYSFHTLQIRSARTLDTPPSL